MMDNFKVLKILNSMKKYIEVKLDIEGLHHWPDCNLPHVEYLAHLHRHTFVINCRHEVTDSNREIEFIDFKHKIKQYIGKRWFDQAYGCCNFGSMSCEHIATDLLDAFGLCRCSVSEDNEFFGIVEI
jgi:hypothetical protein